MSQICRGISRLIRAFIMRRIRDGQKPDSVKGIIKNFNMPDQDTADILLFCSINKMTSNNTKLKEVEESDLLTADENTCQLIVWNDEVNSFDWVIATLMLVCGHTAEQAEQSAIIIHTKGKYAVKEGSYEYLKPMCNAITERGIGATIEVLSEF